MYGQLFLYSSNFFRTARLENILKKFFSRFIPKFINKYIKCKWGKYSSEDTEIARVYTTKQNPYICSLHDTKFKYKAQVKIWKKCIMQH